MKCEVWGHSHTDKNCPRYGKAKDSDQPILQVRLRGDLCWKYLSNDIW